MTKVLDFGVAKVISDHALEMGPRAQTLGQDPDLRARLRVARAVRRHGRARSGPRRTCTRSRSSCSRRCAIFPCARGAPRRVRAEGARPERAAHAAVARRPRGGRGRGGLQAGRRAPPRGPPDGHGAVLGGAEARDSRRRRVGEGAARRRRAVAAGEPWKPQPPAAGQAAPDRLVTADMPAPVVEVVRPGSTAPGPVDPGRSQVHQGAIRPQNSAPQGSPLTSTLVMDSRAHTPPLSRRQSPR